MRTQPEVIALLYWGRRGGGRELTQQLCDVAKSLGFSVINSTRDSTFCNPNHKVSGSFFNFRKWLKQRKNVVTCFKSESVSRVIIPMASPWDIFLGFHFRRHGIKTVRIIHDASPHPGDFFPFNSWIRLLCFDCDLIVTLSDFVKKSLIKLYKIDPSKVQVGAIPFPDVNCDFKPRDMLTLKVLFVGRAKRYKGLTQLIDVWDGVGDDNTFLVIAGDNHKFVQKKRTISIDKWLSDAELVELVCESDVVVLPYIEASQSGLIPLAHALKKPVVARAIGGLQEQIENGVNGILFSSFEELGPAIESALRFEWNLPEVDWRKSQSELLMSCFD